MIHYDYICLVTNDIEHDRRMIRLCKLLHSKGKRVLLVGRMLSQSHREFSLEFEIERIECTFNSGPQFYFEIILRMRRLLRNLKFSNLICADLDTSLVALFQSNDTQKIIDLHEYFEKVPELKDQPFKSWIWRKVGEYMVPKFDHVVTVNESLSKIFSKKYRKEVSFIRNMPDDIRPVSKSLETSLETVYLGVLNPGRGLFELVAAFTEFKGASLTIIGDGPLKKELEIKANLAANIKFVGTVPPEHVNKYLSLSHIGWNLLDSFSESYYYSLANKFFDYTNNGIPVVTMNFPEYASLIEKDDTGYLLDDIEPEHIITALKSIMNDKNTWAVKHQNCVSLSKDYTWANESNKWIQKLGLIE